MHPLTMELHCFAKTWKRSRNIQISCIDAQKCRHNESLSKFSWLPSFTSTLKNLGAAIYSFALKSWSKNKGNWWHRRHKISKLFKVSWLFCGTQWWYSAESTFDVTSLFFSYFSKFKLWKMSLRLQFRGQYSSNWCFLFLSLYPKQKQNLCREKQSSFFQLSDNKTHDGKELGRTIF